jgi:SAM-dependent MidA family methyltransferase
MPVVAPPTSDPTWKRAWDEALYGVHGFFRRESPAAHFRTSVHASPLFARALVRMTREAGLDTIVDIGAGRGELLTAVHELDAGLDLLGVEITARPPDLPPAVAWTTALPESVEGLVVANEWLDNIPCHVVEVDDRGVARVVHVDPTSGRESLGAPVSDRSVPSSLSQWLTRWWPLEPVPGLRAEVGTTRDAAWADVVRRVHRGLAVAIDYGHVRQSRPPLGTLRSYVDGREVDVVPDGSRDVTAHVALDAVASAVGASGAVVRRQREMLRDLGVDGRPPSRAIAVTEPGDYVAALADAAQAAELTAEDGLGGFSWVVAHAPNGRGAAPRP